MKTISCDEAGYTGNNLLADEQPYFVYASVAIDPTEAHHILADARRLYRVQMPEIKGNKLTKTPRGQQAALAIMQACRYQTRVFVIEKRYALAAKFFEYMYEPILAAHSTWFYDYDFHRFISMVLYIHLKTNNEAGTHLLHTFEQAMHTYDVTRMHAALTTIQHDPHTPPILEQIATVCLGNHQAIHDEWDTLRQNTTVGKWVLELTATSVYQLLQGWSDQGEPITVYCDTSKPLAQQLDTINAFITGKPSAVVPFVTQPLQLVDSHTHPGIQIADVFASSLVYAFKHLDRDFATQCITICTDTFQGGNVTPDPQYADLHSWTGFTNRHLLNLLAERTRRQQNLFHQLPQQLRAIQRTYRFRARE